MPDQTDRTAVAAIAAAGVAVVLLLAALAVVLVQIRAPGDRFAACREVRIAGGQTFGTDFSLIDHTGKVFTQDDLSARASLIYFGYTFCPDVCPLDMVRNVDAVDLLAQSGHSVRPVYITVDPERDTARVMAEYADAMYPDLLGVTGDADEVKRVLAAFGGSASRQDDDPDYYLVSHTTLSYLMLPGEGVVALFTRRLAPEDLAEKMACYLEAA